MKVSKYGVTSGPYFLVFGKYGPEITLYLDTFDAVIFLKMALFSLIIRLYNTSQLHSIKPDFRFCADLNPARSVSEIRDGEDI